MEDLLLALLFEIVELVYESLAEAILDLLLRAMLRVFDDAEISNPVFACRLHNTRCVMWRSKPSGLSPSVVRPSKIHGISLLLGPGVAGLVMSLVGARLRAHNNNVVQIESFSYAFVFAFGMALVRFLFVK